MGKTRGHGSRRGAYRGRGKGRGDDEDSEEEYEPQRGLGGQRSNVGMLPPSDSEDDDDEESGAGEAAEKQKDSKGSSSKGGQSKNAGKLPPSGSEDEDDDSEEESEEESSEEPLNEYLSQSIPRKKKVVEEEPDPEQIRKDLERLEMIKKKREDDRLKRIKEEGWDRFAPISDTNKPPGHVPSDHPSQKE